MSTGPSPATRNLVQIRAHYLCEVCGIKEGGQIHHRKPRRMGGTSDPGINLACNLLLVCQPCHSWIEGNRNWSYHHGLLVRGHLDPEVTPVRLRRGTVLLTRDGSYASEPEPEVSSS